MTSLTFSPDMLSSSAKFYQFFQAEREADKQQILHPLNATSDREAADSRLLKEVLKKTISVGTFRFGLELAMGSERYQDVYLTNLAHAIVPFDIAPFKKEDLLASSRNCDQVSSPEIYEQKPIPLSQIDPDIRKQLINQTKEEITFGEVNGKCFGASQWFQTMYFDTKKNFPDTREGRLEHIQAVTTLFSRGVPKGASLLHSLKLVNPIGLHSLQSSRLFIHYQNTPYVLGARVDNLDEFSKQFQNLSPGVYNIFVKKHAATYIKIDSKTAVFFDPNEGSILIDGEKGNYQLAEYIMKKYGIWDYQLDQVLALIHKVVPDENYSPQYESCRLYIRLFVDIITYQLRVIYFNLLEKIRSIFHRIWSPAKKLSLATT